MKKQIQAHIPLSDSMYQKLLTIAKFKKADKNQILLFQDKTCRKFFFIVKGILRGYRLIDGKEYTHHFYTEKWFATDFKSFLTEKPSDLYIETLSATEYYEFNQTDLYQLYTTHHEFEKLGRIIAEKAFLLTAEKLLNIQTLDLKGRYKTLIEQSPELFQQVPQKYIASYLGVSEQSLSRIKAQIR